MKTPISTSCDIRLPRSGLRPLVSICLVAIAAHANWALAADDGLLNGFNNPPSTAKPLVWWHWMNGNVTQDGIAKDLAWMKRVGIGGLQHFDAGLATPQIVDKRLVYMTPEWKDAFRFTAQETDRLGLELTIAASPGWSETGGPWVKPEDGMKKLVWSETGLVGGKRFAGKLAPPPSVTGAFQSMGQRSFGHAMAGDPKVPTYYADVAVLAFPVAAPSAPAASVVRDGNGVVLDGSALTDGDFSTALQIPTPEKGRATLAIEYEKPQTVRSATLYSSGGVPLFFGSNYKAVLEASDDARTWRRVGDLAIATLPTTIGFVPVTARHFRVLFDPRPGNVNPALEVTIPGVDPGGLAAFAGMMGNSAEPLKVAEFELSSEDRIDRYETKAGFEVARDYYALERGLADAKGVDPKQVIDLTARLKPDGTLDWTPPAGHWRVLRLGYSLLGTTNHPASPEATGLEVDKHDGSAVRRYLEHYIGLYRDAAGPDLVGKRGVQAIVTDSIEVGASNWTPRLVAQFKRLRGYDPTPWLPALTGTIVGSRATSDKFLYDYRRTLADLIASEHYGTVATVAHENGLKIYGEALEGAPGTLGDDMSMRRYADIPMSAIWTHPRAQTLRNPSVIDMRGAASVAHVYGQNLVAAEALTSSLAYWYHAPAYLKRIIDLAFVNGVNRPVIHTSVHQPVDDKVPGLSLSIFGQFFNRHESWAELAKPWVDYLSRNSLMLQQGRNYADVAYFYGEEAPLAALFGDGKPVLGAPRTYAYDFVSPDALTGALVNDGGDLATPGGARYRVLYLGGSSHKMTLPTLRKLAELVEGGATVVGARPEGDPGLRGDAVEYAALTAKLWPGGEMTQVGKGRVIASTDVERALAKAGVAPDFRYSGGKEGASIPFLHRKLADGDSYFLVNQQDRTETIEAHFRVTGKAPELWRAETGKTEAVSYRIENGETIVPLTLHADESVHVVFRKVAAEPSRAIKQLEPVEIGRISAPWQVAFQAGRGAPAATTMATLTPLDQSPEAGIKYFSGIATYKNTLVTPRSWRPGKPLWLDLGEAREVAEVLVNGKSAGYAWHAPYRVDIGSAVRPGRNTLEVRVANLWVNRLIGDAQPGAQKITWTAVPTYKADAPLRPSGLLGPVRIISISSQP